MKVKIWNVYSHGEVMEVEVEIPTPDLISELMKRHDCGACANKSDNGCKMCIFNGNFNNFKPSSTAKGE